MNILRISILLAFLLSLISGVLAEECITPENGMAITKSATFCKGEYALPNGIRIIADNVALDCDNAVLRGDFSGTAFTAIGRTGVSIKNCIIQDYENGFYFDNVVDYHVQDNELGVIANRFVNLSRGAEPEEKNTTIQLIVEEQQEQEEKQDNQEQVPEPRRKDREVIGNTITNEGLAEARVAEKDVVNVAVQKIYEPLEQGMRVQANISPHEGVYTIYELIPKSMAQHAGDAVFPDPGFFTFNDDPAKVKVDVNLGEGFSFSYTTPGQEGVSTTLITTESKEDIIKKLSNEKHQAKLQRIFFAIVILFFLITYQLERMAEKRGYRSKRNR
ncbi:hypothetical protein HYS47_00755 [Candidatus Woesearchaeota archaeon]|nr:hypothetical protein [Candidatus Woesearchaeota archaeon]